MATEQPGFKITLEAGQDLSADQYKLVTLAIDGQVDVTGAARTNRPIGILQNKPDAAGKAAELVISGVSKAIAGEAIEEGELVSASSAVAGRVDDADTATDVIIGMALTPAAVAGTIISILLFGGAGGEVS